MFKSEPAVMVHAYNLRTWEPKTGGFHVGPPWAAIVRFCLKKPVKKNRK